MNKTSLYAKLSFILLAMGFAAVSVIPAHANDKRDMKSYARQINEMKWDRDCRKVEATAQKNPWKLRITDFSDAMPYRIIVMLGGIRMPSVPPAAMAPVARSAS